MSRLIVLSNRVKMPDNNPMAGGLAVALHDLLSASSGIWMGWNGDIRDRDSTYPNDELFDSRQAPDNQTTYLTTALSAEHYQHFYCGFANSVLWLLLHEQPDLITQNIDDYAGYQAVNLLFAKQLKKIIEPDDVIWVHDYHFLSVAYYCRQLGITNRIGFFLHIPFAPLRFWQQLEQSAELIRHLGYYDLLGTQTEKDKVNCITVFQHYLKDSILNNVSVDTLFNRQHPTQSCRSLSANLLLNLESVVPHSLAINAYPIGVNVAKIQQQVSHLSSLALLNVQENTKVKAHAQQIIAVDRIDYSKGLLERFEAYRYFLQQNPAYQKQLKLLQVACPSRLDLAVYQRLYNEVRHAVDEVNRQFIPCEILDACQKAGMQASHFETNLCITKELNFDKSSANLTNHWQAITYNESVLSHEKLMTLFWHSDIGWVNSLKDGMNLVAKEYIAAQNPDNPGVLLLSRYAGAAEQMQSALVIDPQQMISVANGLKRALVMPLAERKSRYQELLQNLNDYDLQAWGKSFLDDLYSHNDCQITSPQLADIQTSD